MTPALFFAPFPDAEASLRGQKEKGRTEFTLRPAF